MNKNLLNILEYENLARTILPSITYNYYSAGACDEITVKQNILSFQKIMLLPKILKGVSNISLSTEILGTKFAMPLFIAPMALQGLANKDGELATAQAAAQFEIGMILSVLSNKSLEEVATIKGFRWLQLYVLKDRGITKHIVERAYQAGYSAICLTVDTPYLGKREIVLKRKFHFSDIAKLRKLSLLRKGTNPGNLKELKANTGSRNIIEEFNRQIDPGLTWKDIEWLQSLTPLPVIIKGVMRPDDARSAVGHGVKGIIVSNHGGRQLDGTVSAIDALPKIVAAVEKQAEVLVDGGIRRGTDILKVLALGAKGVLIGRPILWGLTVDGKKGVCDVLELLSDELKLAMGLCGCQNISEIDQSLISPYPVSVA